MKHLTRRLRVVDVGDDREVRMFFMERELGRSAGTPSGDIIVD
jgi:hypothetical protein